MQESRGQHPRRLPFPIDFAERAREKKSAKPPMVGPQGQKPGVDSSPSHITSGGQNGPQSMRHISRTREPPPPPPAGDLFDEGATNNHDHSNRGARRNNAEANAGELETRTAQRGGGGGEGELTGRFSLFARLRRGHPRLFKPSSIWAPWLLPLPYGEHFFPNPISASCHPPSSQSIVPPFRAGLEKRVDPDASSLPSRAAAVVRPRVRPRQKDWGSNDRRAVSCRALANVPLEAPGPLHVFQAVLGGRSPS